MEAPMYIRTAQSSASDAREAAREFHSSVVQADMALVLFFCSPRYDLEELALEMARLFDAVEVVGCTTAGEIGPSGYRDHSISGVSFAAGSLRVATGKIGDLQRFEMADGRDFAQSLLQRLEAIDPTASADNSFAFLMADGLSIREEQLARTLQSTLGQIPVVGGSAGDGLDFKKTYVYFDGAFHGDSAVVILATTRLPFTAFKTQHIVSTDQRVVVTGADPERRLVTEIDGWPAADAYARLIGADVRDLSPALFAARPMVVVVDGADYVRSIQKANPDGSLTLFCAIEEGLVLRGAMCRDLMQDLQHEFADIRATIGDVRVVIGCDCILRKLELAQDGLIDRVERVFRDHNVVGFSSYGEQYCGVHVNQTLTGIAIGGAASV
ncbi:MAG: nitric oxide-sensing protein NosP [Solirubrobacteraceae bacterium]